MNQDPALLMEVMGLLRTGTAFVNPGSPLRDVRMGRELLGPMRAQANTAEQGACSLFERIAKPGVDASVLASAGHCPVTVSTNPPGIPAFDRRLAWRSMHEQ